jgi:hypothetical protein
MHLGRQGRQAYHRSKEWYEYHLEGSGKEARARNQENPTPYQLEWLTKGNDVRVSKYCQLSFSIGGKYVDRVWCDMVDMTMCHLLLGKSWQDDKAAVYDETKNTYSFMLGKTKLTLLQSPWPKPQPLMEWYRD